MAADACAPAGGHSSRRIGVAWRWCCTALLGFTSCYASNVVALDKRAVQVSTDALEWTPATATDLAGTFGSVEISGEAAGSLRYVVYVFLPEGRYTAAALVSTAGEPTFQVASGTWSLQPEGLTLDASPPQRVWCAPDHLKIQGRTGVVVLKRIELR